MEQNESYILVLQVMSIFSVTASCLAIINTAFLHLHSQSDQSFSNHSISIAIIFICLGDAIGNSPYLTEFRPNTGSRSCTVTGFFNMFGYSLSWTWTLYISFILYSLCVLEKMPENFKLHATFAFGVPFLFALIQLTVFGFSSQESEPYDVCIFSRKNDGEIIYHYVTYYGLFSICLLGMIYMRYQQYLLEYNNDYRINSKIFVASKAMLKHYPWILAICWIPRVILLSLLLIPTWLRLFTVCLKISHGMVITFVYFHYGEQPRKTFLSSLNPLNWLMLLKNGKQSMPLLGLGNGFSEEFSMSIFKNSEASTDSSQPIRISATDFESQNRKIF
jgi:hypothetical protein